MNNNKNINNKLVINLPEDVVNYLERLSYEYESCKDNIAFLLDSRRDDENLLESVAFKKYCEKQDQTKAEFEEAKYQVQQKFIPKKLLDHKFNWEIPRWQQRELIVTILCDCGIDILNEIKGEK